MYIHTKLYIYCIYTHELHIHTYIHELYIYTHTLHTHIYVYIYIYPHMTLNSHWHNITKYWNSYPVFKLCFLL